MRDWLSHPKAARRATISGETPHCFAFQPPHFLSFSAFRHLDSGLRGPQRFATAGWTRLRSQAHLAFQHIALILHQDHLIRIWRPPLREPIADPSHFIPYHHNLPVPLYCDLPPRRSTRSSCPPTHSDGNSAETAKVMAPPNKGKHRPKTKPSDLPELNPFTPTSPSTTTGPAVQAGPNPPSGLDAAQTSPEPRRQAPKAKPIRLGVTQKSSMAASEVSPYRIFPQPRWPAP